MDSTKKSFWLDLINIDLKKQIPPPPKPPEPPKIGRIGRPSRGGGMAME